MSTSVLIIGESGTGKSYSIRNLKPEETFIINVDGKSLPIKGWRSFYERKEGGNYIESDKVNYIQKVIKNISDNRPHVKQVIVDDSQFIVGNQFMSQICSGTWDDYKKIGYSYFVLLESLKYMRDDLIIIVMSHSEEENGVIKCKTYGKAVDTHVLIESKFTYVLRTVVINDEHFFQTKTEGKSRVKSPPHLFPERFIPNDLQYVCEKIREFES
jgi:hypothetical protein